jgi:tyrosyl-tRNA synthetase
MKSPDEQLEIICRGVDAIVPEEELRAKLRRSVAEDRPLRVKYGIDPTGIDVHLGHTVPLRKMRQFQDLGHQAVIIIGNYTALVGDPSGRDETRARLTPEQVEQNARDYLAQVGKVVDLDRAEVVRNGDWFGRMSFLDILNLASRMTVARLLERDDFTKRMREEKPIYLHECLYPLMQGWDSVEVRADVELGGTEQLFSLMAARDLQREQGQQPQVAVTFPILVGTDGVRRMGKSLGNYIGVSDPPDEMFGKVMSIPDEAEQEDGRRLNVIRQYFELLTDVPAEEVDSLLAPGKNPKDAKVALAKDIVAQYHGADAAENAAVEFDRRFRDKEDPSQIPGIRIQVADTIHVEDRVPLKAVDLLLRLNAATSASDARRLIAGRAVRVGPDRRLIEDPFELVNLEEGMVVRVGKRRVYRVELEQ